MGTFFPGLETCLAQQPTGQASKTLDYYSPLGRQLSAPALFLAASAAQFGESMSQGCHLDLCRLSLLCECGAISARAGTLQAGVLGRQRAWRWVPEHSAFQLCSVPVVCRWDNVCPEVPVMTNSVTYFPDPSFRPLG